MCRGLSFSVMQSPFFSAIYRQQRGVPDCQMSTCKDSDFTVHASFFSVSLCSALCSLPLSPAILPACSCLIDIQVFSGSSGGGGGK